MKKENEIYFKAKNIFFHIILCILAILTLALCTSGILKFCLSPIGVLQKKPTLIFLWGWILFFFLCTILFLGIRMFREQSIKKHLLYRIILLVFIVILQLICLSKVGKITLTTDSFKVIDMASNMLSTTHGILDNSENTKVLDGYFSRYGNNNFFAIVLFYFFSLVKYFGGNQFIAAARIWNVIMIDIGIILTYLSARKMWGVRKADIVLLLIALSPTTYLWLFWSYTNTFSIPFVMGILLLSLYSKEEENKKKLILYGIIMGIIGIVGCFLRPTTSIPMIAIVILQLCSLKKIDKDNIKKLCLWLASFLLAITIGAAVL